MQTAVEYLVKEFSAILGPLKTEPMQDLLLVDAIERANKMFEQQIIDAAERWKGTDFAEKYYNETYKPELTSQLPGINVNDVKPSNPQMVKDIF